MLNFISFGSGSSGNCYFLYTENDGLLIDVGVGIRSLKKHFRDYGLPLSRIRRLLITHDHADHIKSVGTLSHEFHLPVFATRSVHEGIDRNYCVQRKVAAELRQYVEPGTVMQLGDFRVTAFPVPHDASDNVGYMVEVGGVVFCLMTDIGHVTDEMARYIGLAHYLVIEANHDPEMLVQGPYPERLKVRIQSNTGHLSNAACGEAIAQHMTERLRHVWLCHLSQENNHPELARKTVESVLRGYGIVAGHDLELEVLKRTMPSGNYALVSPSQEDVPEEPAQDSFAAARACIEKGDLVNGIALLTKSMVLDGDRVEVRQLRAETLLAMGDVKGAAKDAEWLLARADEQEETVLLAARIAAREGRVEAAIGLYGKVIGLNPGSLAAYRERGSLRFALGDKQGAQQDMQKVLELHPDELSSVTGDYSANGTEQRVRLARSVLNPFGL